MKSERHVTVGGSDSELAAAAVFQLSSSFGLSLRVEQRSSGANQSAVVLSVEKDGKVWAHGELILGSTQIKLTTRKSFGGVALLAETGQSRFAARFVPAADLAGVQVFERARGPVIRWQWHFLGTTVHTHKQLAVISMPAEKARFPMGAFTQYGQLLNVKDWAVADDGKNCTGLIGIGVGKWSHPTVAALRGNGTRDGLTLDMRWKDSQHARTHGNAVKRSYLLVHAPTMEVITPTRLGIDYFEPEQGFASWPAAVIARYGTSRPQRIVALKRTLDSIEWQRPTQFLFGDDRDLQNALARVKRDPRLAKAHPLWAGQIAEAKQMLFEEMERFQTALRGWTFLHPLGNAVAIRPFAPLCILFHMLDYQGYLTDAERRHAAELIADVAEVVLRKDFYPHDYATHPPEFPYGPNSFYRGMLNQNFNTDGYVLVGMAGCVLRQHPRAKLWRHHAVEQFESQMRAYVWPGGAWEESHTYANHVKLTLMPFVWAMRFMPEKLDLLANARFRETCRFFPLLLSPPDVIAGGTRAIPAAGDHGYLHANYSTLFGWLAALCDEPDDTDRTLFTWAWQQTGGKAEETFKFMSLLNPLLLPEEQAPVPAPNLPRLLDLTGYGASFRGGDIGKPNETLLVVRCGLSWGHYQSDQGSFWWWAHGRLLCCDADLGGGELKFLHRGSSVLAYPDREPLQHLDRPNYHVDQCSPRPGGGAMIRCQIPVDAWGPANKEVRIPVVQRPHDVRYFEYDGQDHLTIIDEPTKSPDQLVMWCLHVPAKSASREGEQRVIFELDGKGNRLAVDLPTKPLDVGIKQFGATFGLFCRYPEQRLVHGIRFIGA